PVLRGHPNVTASERADGVEIVGVAHAIGQAQPLVLGSVRSQDPPDLQLLAGWPHGQVGPGSEGIGQDVLDVDHASAPDDRQHSRRVPPGEGGPVIAVDEDELQPARPQSSERPPQLLPNVAEDLEGGAVSYRGAQYFYSDSPKLNRLNSVAVVFE